MSRLDESQARRDAEQLLPSAEIEYPTCGSCGGETSHDGDTFTCEDCGLYFDPTTLRPNYLDDRVAPCGVPCVEPLHSPTSSALDDRVPWECTGCLLPAGHTSPHRTGCHARFQAGVS